SVDPVAAAEESIAKAERTRGAQDLEPRTYRAVLEPYALGELLQLFAYETFSGLSLLEERSYAAGRLGEQVFDEKISIDDAPRDEFVEAVADGIYVTRLHYLSSVYPREGVITGMTRDGTFRIRDGKIAAPLVNLRFTVSVPEMLRDIPALARETALVNQSAFYDERYPYGALVPALATASFAVNGTGAAPGI